MGPLMMGIQARSSVGERYLDTVEVGGSIPPVPTITMIESLANRNGLEVS